MSVNADGHGHSDSGHYGRTPMAMDVQSEAYHEVYDEMRMEAEHGAAGHPASGHEKTESLESQDHTKEGMSTVEMITNPNLPPFLRTNNRISYMTEYIDFWRWEKLHWILFLFWLAAAVFTATVFPLGALLMFALAARFRNMVWYDRFVYGLFGVNRSLIVVD